MLGRGGGSDAQQLRQLSRWDFSLTGQADHGSAGGMSERSQGFVEFG
ncbi:MAG: hypothetical protein M3Y42_08315 [Actinomycetota bacterium]|nr:hypothetical protein [Actinomycetota bacterium]